MGAGLGPGRKAVARAGCAISDLKGFSSKFRKEVGRQETDSRE